MVTPGTGDFFNKGVTKAMEGGLGAGSIRVPVEPGNPWGFPPNNGKYPDLDGMWFGDKMGWSVLLLENKPCIIVGVHEDSLGSYLQYEKWVPEAPWSNYQPGGSFWNGSGGEVQLDTPWHSKMRSGPLDSSNVKARWSFIPLRMCTPTKKKRLRATQTIWAMEKYP